MKSQGSTPTSKPVRVRSDGRMTRARIVAGGLELAAIGWEKVTFQALADQFADITWQGIKHHYRTVPSLQVAILEHARHVVANKEIAADVRARARQIIKTAAPLGIE